MPGPFDHAVYQTISKMNGKINKMNKDTLKKKLFDLKLDDRGVVEVLKKRLKNYHKRQLLKESIGITKDMISPFDYLLVIDFEATCEEDDNKYNHEIIEFPIILVDVRQHKIIDEFHEYVQPTINNKLTQFCTRLTGITQAKVDASEDFTHVFDHVNEWMTQKALHTTGKRFAIVTDGSADMSTFLVNQCRISGLDYPPWARRWINMRKIYNNCYSLRRGNLATMLDNLDMDFEGTPHCGIDDARNIARICIQLLKDGSVFNNNEFLPIDETGNDTTMKSQNSGRKRQKVAKDTKVSDLEKSLDILAADEENGANPDDVDMLRKFGCFKLT